MSYMNFTLVHVAASDLHFYKERLIPLLYDMWVEEAKMSLEILGYVHDTFKDFDSNLERILTSDFVLAIHGGSDIVGFTSFVYLEEFKVGYVNLLCVDPRYRRLGIGKSLMSEFMTLIPKGSSLELSTQMNNLPALKLYESLGFKQNLVVCRRIND